MALQTELQLQGNFLFKHRSYLPLIFIFIGLSVYLYGKFYEIAKPENIIEENFEIICLAVSIIGLLIRIKIVGHTPKRTSGRNTKKGQRPMN